MGSLSPACCGLLPLLKFRFLLELRRVSVPCRLIEGPAPGAEAVCIAIIPFAARSAGNLLHRCSLLCSAAGRSQVPAGQPSTVGLLLQQPAHGHLCLTEIFSQFPLEPPCPLLLCRRGLSGRGGPATPDPDRLVEGPAPGAEAIHIVVIPLSAVLTVCLLYTSIH